MKSGPGRWLRIPGSKSKWDRPVAAVRRGAPKARLIVDANQAWSVPQLIELAPMLAQFKIDLLEQPVPADGDAGLASLDLPIPICADEPVHTPEDVQRLVGPV